MLVKWGIGGVKLLCTIGLQRQLTGFIKTWLILKVFWEYSQPIEYNQKVENKYWTQLEEAKSCFSWGFYSLQKGGKRGHVIIF